MSAVVDWVDQGVERSFNKKLLDIGTNLDYSLISD